MTNKRDELCDLLDVIVTTRTNIYYKAKDYIKRLLCVYRASGNEEILKDIRLLATSSSISYPTFCEIEKKWL